MNTFDSLTVRMALIAGLVIASIMFLELKLTVPQEAGLVLVVFGLPLLPALLGLED